jgi:fructosamine-3-kinase
MIPEAVRTWLTENGHGDRITTSSVGGGCINNSTVLKTERGETFFLKTNRRCPADMFAREAEGLLALRVSDGPRVPEPYLWGGDFILLEDLSPAPRRPVYWSQFGRCLALLHNHVQAEFGFNHDNYIGSTPQPNDWTSDGYVFFAQHRLNFQAKLALESGLLDPRHVHRVEALTAKLPDLVPPQPASLIHGDLWSGNALTGPQGEPAIIDPATHYGWGEAELAMTALFGAFADTFYLAYQEVRPLEPGYRGRFPIYNLYHLLNHLNLFGRGYLGQVLSILDRYA